MHEFCQTNVLDNFGMNLGQICWLIFLKGERRRRMCLGEPSLAPQVDPNFACKLKLIYFLVVPSWMTEWDAGDPCGECC